MSEKELIDMYTKELRLSSVRENVQLFAEDAAREQWGHLTFLRRLLEAEAAAKRERSKATVITTNLPFTRWEEVLKDKVLCSALVDRLCHKSYLVNMTGTSYRINETKKF